MYKVSIVTKTSKATYKEQSMYKVSIVTKTSKATYKEVLYA